jgi:hypothetical protein
MDSFRITSTKAQARRTNVSSRYPLGKRKSRSFTGHKISAITAVLAIRRRRAGSSDNGSGDDHRGSVGVGRAFRQREPAVPVRRHRVVRRLQNAEQPDDQPQFSRRSVIASGPSPVVSSIAGMSLITL